MTTDGERTEHVIQKSIAGVSDVEGRLNVFSSLQYTSMEVTMF
jgi:hypothetical protein